MTRFGKLLAVLPFNVAVRGVPSGLNKSRRTVILLVALLAMTTSVAHPPPVANCGSKRAPSPPTPVVITGNPVVGVCRLVNGMVLKFSPLNRNPIAANGSGVVPLDVTA